MLIVLRGNSASGKSTIAAILRTRLGRPTAVLAQDYFRRVVYDEREQESLAHSDLLEAAAAHCLAARQNVVMDGIFNATRYSPMLQRVQELSDDARFYAFDLTLEETVVRHESRDKAGDFTAEQLSEWYHGWQPLEFVEEKRIGPEESPTEIVDRILANR